ncbi:MAG: hypothetical protein JJ975_07875 [Bacteroidia bacterium]|nr:hypothetical protein [Bacteroidia bacterium]
MEKGMLHAHSWLRWVLLIIALLAIVSAIAGWLGKKPYTKTHNRLALFLTISADLQLLIGLVLYFFVSAITKTAFQDFGAAMKNPEIRFYAVEHILVMIIGIALFHIGKVKAKKADSDVQKHKISAIYYGIGLLLILSRIPWESGRLGF